MRWTGASGRLSVHKCIYIEYHGLLRADVVVVHVRCDVV